MIFTSKCILWITTLTILKTNVDSYVGNISVIAAKKLRQLKKAFITAMVFGGWRDRRFTVVASKPDISSNHLPYEYICVIPTSKGFELMI